MHYNIEPQKTALVIHEVVNYFIDPAASNYDPHVLVVLERIQELLKVARAAGIDVIFFTPDEAERWGETGADVPKEFGPFGNDVVIRKEHYGGWHGSRMEPYLFERGIEYIILCGIALTGGVDPTLRSAHNRDFKVILASDATMTRHMKDEGWGALTREQVEQVYFTVYMNRFAQVATTQDIIKEIIQNNTAE